MNLHVIAYPELSTADYERIQSYRREYNSLYTVIQPHFTIVFSVPDMELPDFVREVRAQTGGAGVIRFCFRCAVVNKYALSDNYDAFLVPDEGFSRIVRLHDRLYSDRLSRHHRLDIPYIPHLSIANSTDPQLIRAIVDKWNKTDFEMHGVISSLDIINYENQTITTMEKVHLR